MKRLLLAALAAGLFAPPASAHFVFVVPAADGKTAAVVLSEDLSPDDGVSADKIAKTKLALRDAAGADSPVATTAEAHALKAALSGDGPRVVFGSLPYGVMARKDTKPYLLMYHPKALVGRVDPAKAAVGGELPCELTPVAYDGVTRLQLTAAGKPVADAEVTLLKPDDTKAKLKTGKDGRTDPITAAGRYGAWTRFTEPKAGELDGKKYEEVKHYATLVFDHAPAQATSQAPVASPYPPLPTAASSLGAVVCDGYLYVYGGHAGQTHSYDTKSVLGTFHRLKLDGGTAWEPLPGGPIAQGMNLAAHGGKVYRVGGMSPRNQPGEPADNHSLADAARFDPATGKWEELPPMPAGRSSHDLVVVGDKLVVVGGWCAKGKDAPSMWHDTALVLDLAAAAPVWKAVPQPFQRRALSAAAVGGKVYVVGGLSADGTTDKRTDVLDVAAGTWATGPELPGTARVAFSPAAAVVGGRVVVNTSAGMTHRLKADASGWEPVGPTATNRMVARLVPTGPAEALLVGGASRGGNIGVVEVVSMPGQ